MSTNCEASVAAHATPDHASQSLHRRVDRIDEPARPLGEKRAALHAQRQRDARMNGTAAPRATSGFHERVLTSKHTAIAFLIDATADGLVVERTQRQTAAACVVQTLVFGDEAEFDRYCESEPLRFDDPAVYDQLRRKGHEALVATKR
ncbi:MAG: hypothetical protein EOO80_01685 [Oxalobacteraceae bacterium]|nr:MAG: hypothetical protein EOO80_01685 [Oxalobacteraceae bacterium]